MKNFTIIEEIFVGIENGISMKRVEIMCDSDKDIPEPETEWATGSCAYSIETGTFYLLKSSGKWINNDTHVEELLS